MIRQIEESLLHRSGASHHCLGIFEELWHLEKQQYNEKEQTFLLKVRVAFHINWSISHDHSFQFIKNTKASGKYPEGDFFA